MVAVGLWGAQLGSPAIWMLPVAFPMVMALGGMLGLMGVPLPGIEVGIATSGILLGSAVLFEFRPRVAVAAGLVAFFAVFHGHAHGTELPAGQSALLYSLGFVVATGTLHAIGIGIGEVRRLTSGRTVLRAAGAVVAAGGGVLPLPRPLRCLVRRTRHPGGRGRPTVPAHDDRTRNPAWPPARVAQRQRDGPGGRCRSRPRRAHGGHLHPRRRRCGAGGLPAPTLGADRGARGRKLGRRDRAVDARLGVPISLGQLESAGRAQR